MSKPQMIFNIKYTSKTPPASWSAEYKAEYLKRRSFYDLTAEYNYVSYSLNGEKVAKNKDIATYMDKNTGAFGLDGVVDEKKLEEIKKNLKNSGSHIWSGFLSFEEELSKRNFETMKDSQEFFVPEFKKFIKDTHLDINNIELVASLHTDTNNNHIHFFFYEKEPLRRNKKGELCYSRKGVINHKALENCLMRCNLDLDDRRYELHTARDRAKAQLEKIFAQKRQPDLVSVALRKLAKSLPDSGRLGYNSRNMKALRPQVDNILNMLCASDEILRQSVHDFYGAVADRERKIAQLAKDNKFRIEQGNKISFAEYSAELTDKIRDEFRGRAGQPIIKAALEIKRGEIKSKQTRPKINDLHRKIYAKRNRVNVKHCLKKLQHQISIELPDLSKQAQQRLHEIQREISQEELIAAGALQ